jgi:PAS domain S-box-containing protein
VSTDAPLRSSQQRLRAILTSLPVLVVAYDRDKICTIAEGRGLAALGVRPEEIVGHLVDELLQDLPEMRDSSRAALDGVVSTCTLQVGDIVLDTYHTPLLDDDGSIIGGLGVAVDVTRRHRAEQAAQDANAALRDSLERLRKVDADRQRLLTHLVTAQEEERSRIAADVHDDSLQALAAVKMRLEMLIASLDDEQRARLELVEQDLDAASNRLRRLLFQLRPSALDHGTLGEAIEQLLAESVEAETTAHVYDNLAASPDGDAKAVVYRIVQEAVANAVKHARAATIEVHLDDHDGGLLVSVRDDGVGFDYVHACRSQLPGHLGLSTMRQRADIAGGWLSVDTRPGSGTVVGFWVPLGGRAAQPAER